MMMRMNEDASHDDESVLAEVKETDKMMTKRVFGGEVDNMMMMMDRERSSTGGSSSDETESPKSVLVIKVMRRLSSTSYSKEKNMAGMSRVHSQILRIRYEDSHVGEDISEALSLFAKDHRHFASLLVFSKPILPSSPLGGTGTGTRNTFIETSD